MKTLTNGEMHPRSCAVVDEDLTIVALFDRIKDGETVEYYYLKDSEGLLQSVVEIKDVLEFLAPYILFIDGDNVDMLRDTVGQVPLKTLARKSYPALSLHRELPEILQALFSAGASAIPMTKENQVVIGEMTLAQLLKKFPLGGMEKHYAVS